MFQLRDFGQEWKTLEIDIHNSTAQAGGKTPTALGGVCGFLYPV